MSEVVDVDAGDVFLFPFRARRGLFQRTEFHLLADRDSGLFEQLDHVFPLQALKGTLRLQLGEQVIDTGTPSFHAFGMACRACGYLLFNE
ncbi:hypothetical protein ACR6C2_08290 [Streptomyces sp. INA 01156]